MKILITVTCGFFLILTSTAQVFVKFDAQGANNGSSWQNAYSSLDSAINRTASGQIWVAAGTYKPAIDINTPFKKFKTFYINKNIALYGGFNGTETNLNQRDIDRNLTILSGNIGLTGSDADNTPRVVCLVGSSMDSTTILDGFTVTKSYYSAGYDYGNGGIYIEGGIYGGFNNPTIRNCTVTDNFGLDGGGIYVRNAAPLIINNLITGNTAFSGAGIYLADGQSHARIINNRITKNKCAGGYSNLSGAGIKIEAYCSPYIYGNLIDSNSADYGAGISNNSNYSVIISNNIISNNSGRDGAGILVDFSETHIINNLIANNHATNNGGGLYVDYSMNTRSINNTIVNNSSSNNGGAVYMQDGNMRFVNCIIYGNSTKYSKPVYSVNNNRTDWYPKFENCNIENGKEGFTYINSYQIPIDNLWKSGNLSVYPNFVDSAKHNYELTSQSACINTGKTDTSGLNLPMTDILGNQRITNGTIDMGSYEFVLYALPAKLVKFTAFKNENFADINWKIDNITDALHFELEKSTDGEVFNKLSQISIDGSQADYYYQDKLLNSGNNYYRLKIVQKDGAFIYSVIVSVIAQNLLELQLSPVPVEAELTYKLKKFNTPGKYSVVIFNMQGRVVYKAPATTSNGTGKLDIGFLPPGNYLFQLLGLKDSFKKIFMKQ